jgi:hypothetical protein
MRGLVITFSRDVRTASDCEVGQGSSSSFQRVATNQRQEGNAIQIYPTANTNAFIRYYVDTNSQKLKLVMSGESNVIVLATAVTNRLAFTIEDPWGNVATNELPSEVFGLNLQFSSVGIPGGHANLNQAGRLQTRVHRRNSYGYQ